ncbi:Amino acid transporter avt1h [Thalictrum thalictroides]|uniref:Amino acid transporter avt1h n=1 Tax=Thalictrum thalictroides TaxID=46969 RepID=A0A7J6W7A7_THATH|nr:Amino acid transporter avt1h [Thalictrum thalictroides]
MWSGNWKSILLRLKSEINQPHRNQVVSESVHGAELAKKYLSNCNVCVEENKGCKCEFNNEVSKIVVNATKDGSEHRVNANSSFAHSVINMVGMLIGLGQLSTPYALENGGWASAFLLIGLGIACAYTSHLLGKCLKDKASSRNYSDIGNQAFGTKGRLIAATFIYMEIFMALVSYTISLSDNLTTVFSGAHLKLPCIHLSTSQILTVFAVLVALPSLWLRDLSSISFLSSGGILMSLLIFTTVALTAVSGAVKAAHSIPFLKLQNIPAISGLYIFSFAGHIVFPDIYKSMKDPSKFTKVSIVSFGIVTALYTSLAFMGASMFGPEVNSQITLSMPPHLILTKIALWATVLTPMTKYALEFAPIAMQLEHSLPCNMSSRMRMFIRGSIGSLLLIGILGLALSVPYFQYVLGLTGSLVSIAISIIFPCAFYIKIHWLQISKPALVLNVFLIVFGFVSGVFGTISSSKSLFRSIQKGPK